MVVDVSQTTHSACALLDHKKDGAVTVAHDVHNDSLDIASFDEFVVVDFRPNNEEHGHTLDKESLVEHVDSINRSLVHRFELRRENASLRVCENSPTR